MAVRSQCAPVSCLAAELGPGASRLSSPCSWLKDLCEVTLCFTAEFFSCHQGPLTFQALNAGQSGAVARFRQNGFNLMCLSSGDSVLELSLDCSLKCCCSSR